MNLRPRRRPATRTGGGTTTNFDEAEAFVGHARWLIEYHNKRADTFSTRAVALLGFTGVILALFSRTRLPGDSALDIPVFVLIVATVGLLLLTAYFCLRTLLVTNSSAPGADDLKDMWTRWASNTRRGKAHGDIAETYIKAKKPDIVNPVEDAIQEADHRSDYFKNAVAAMLAALFVLAILLLVISSQMLGGR